MRRNDRGSSFRLAAGRLTQRVALAMLSMAMLLCSGLAKAEPGAPDTVAKLIADVAQANQRLQDVGAEIQTEQESVNKALVDVETARDNAATAQHDVEASRQAVKDANAAIAAAQRLDKFAAASYVNGPSSSYFKATSPDDIIATAAAGQTLVASSRQVMDNLQRARTAQVNKESAARLAKQKADTAVADTQSSQDAAVAALTNAHRRFAEQQQQVSRLAGERNAAQAKLDAARNWSAPSGGEGAARARPPRRPPVTGGTPRRRARPAVPLRATANGPARGIPPCRRCPAPTFPETPSRSSTRSWGSRRPRPRSPPTWAAASCRRWASLHSHRLHQRPDPAGVWTPGLRVCDSAGDVADGRALFLGRRQRGGSKPGHRIRLRHCRLRLLRSGPVPFAGVGIKLPHYSGSQYNLGRKIPSSQMRRGDVIFYGPGGSQHVTIYLGNGQMLEAPDIGLKVRVAPVRTSGMTPYVIRYIEY